MSREHCTPDDVTVIPATSSGCELRLDSEGLTARTKRKDVRHAWSQVTGFKIAKTGGTLDAPNSGVPVIGLFLRDPAVGLRARAARRVVRTMYGVDDTVPGVYRNEAEVLEALERYHAKYGAGR